MIYSYIENCSPFILDTKETKETKVEMKVFNKSNNGFILYKLLSPILHLDSERIKIDYNNKNTIFYYLYTKINK